MAGKRSQQRLVGLVDLLRAEHPDLDDPESAVRDGAVLVDGVVVTNVRSRARRDAAIKIDQRKTLRGSVKLAAALDAFEVPVVGRTALDLGAATGGFTSVLLDRGADTVFAVDVGYGLLLGSLRQSPQVRNLERTNLADLTPELLGTAVDIVTMDLSYLSLAKAIGQIEHLDFTPGADLIALVKPMYELGLGELPTEQRDLDTAVELAVAGIERSSWSTRGVIPSPAKGSRGATEFLLVASRA
jgi:23S rRNA (cytidine1920-2'-O)/16S rRNA (cytidine1409-2'-O)-methyltransferase